MNGAHTSDSSHFTNGFTENLTLPVVQSVPIPDDENAISVALKQLQDRLAALEATKDALLDDLNVASAQASSYKAIINNLTREKDTAVSQLAAKTSSYEAAVDAMEADLTYLSEIDVRKIPPWFPIFGQLTGIRKAR